MCSLECINIETALSSVQALGRQEQSQKMFEGTQEVHKNWHKTERQKEVYTEDRHKADRSKERGQARKQKEMNSGRKAGI